MWGLQFGHQDPEDVEEEEDVTSYTEEAREVGDPLHPHLRRGCILVSGVGGRLDCPARDLLS